MAERKWGVKRTCEGCGVRFYDLNCGNPRCPKCGAAGAADKPAKPRRRAAPREPLPDTAPPPEHPVAEPPSGAVETAEAEDEDENENDLDAVKGDDDGVIEDAAELRQDDDDDVSEVREHVDNAVEDKT